MKIQVGEITYSENGELVGKPFELDVHKHLIERGLAIFGMRGSGKSYLVGKILEELAEAGQPFLVVDLMGEYVTLKEKYPVVVMSLGNEPYADVKAIKPEMSRAIARTVLETGQAAVIDLKPGTMLEKFRFLAEFLPAFYHEAERLKRPIVLVLDEAHRLTPEKSLIRLKELKEYQNKVMYYLYDVGATGRHHGIGYIAVARREAEVAKSTVTQCELEIHFKAKGIDVEKLKEKTSLAQKVSRFEKGEALVLGLEDDIIIIRVGERKCTHGGVTPSFKPVQVSADFLSKLQEALKSVKYEEAEPEALRKTIEKQRRQIERLKDEVEKLKVENRSLKLKLEDVKARAREVPPEVELKLEELKDDLSAAKKRIEELEARNAELEKQLSEASRLEEKIERMREAAVTLRDWLFEISEAFDLDLIPEDVMELRRKYGEVKEKLEIYERTEKEKALRIKETLEDPAVKSWVQSAKRTLGELKLRAGIMPEILKQAIRYAPDVVFYPEEFDAGVTVETVRKNLKELAGKKILIEDSSGGRLGFKNGIYLWVTNNVRKIRPMAPDEAVERIVSELVEYVLK